MRLCILKLKVGPVTEHGTLYVCEVCGRKYRSYRTAADIVGECRGTDEQWLAKRRELLRLRVREHGIASQATYEQADLCCTCRQWNGSGCRRRNDGSCAGKSWLRWLERGERCEPEGDRESQGMAQAEAGSPRSMGRETTPK